MAFTASQFQAVMTGSEEERTEALCQLLDYPIKQLDPEGSRFWYLRPGKDKSEAEDTCPIAVGFFRELNQGSKKEIEQWLTDEEQDREIRGHYTGRIATEQPVMYVLLPDGNSQGNVALVLPTESRLRQRSIQVFNWTAQDLQARLNRLSWESLAQKVTERITGFVPQVDWIFFKPAATAKELAQLLASVARRIEQAMPDVYESEGENGYLHNLLKSFQKELIANLKLKADNDKDYSFADIYAQTIAYGLFTARVFSFVKNPKADFSRDGAWSQLPETNPFLRQLFKDISEQSPEDLGDELVDAIGEAIAILRAAEMDAILADFRSKMNREDIVIRFYEDFLAAYKPTMRERRGVYYTPEPVVSYMVRSVDELIKDKFGKPLGIADPEVMILDPACGTGTFLLWIFKLIHERHQANPEAFKYQDWNEYVDHCLLPRIFGFELLMAPYAICHLKLGLFLEGLGYKFESSQRLRVYLTNTLDDSIKKSETLLEEYISEESNQATEIKKNKPVMVIIGNPPYSPSIFEGDRIMALMQSYKEGLNEKKSDLIREEWKFLRFSQEKIDSLGQGIVSFVINNTFLDAVTHRSLRKSLIKCFDEIIIFDLHGSVKKQEKSPDGSKDEGVFDIQQGVSLATFIRYPKRLEEISVQYADCWGLRKQKYDRLNSEGIKQTPWQKILPDNPYFFLSQKNFSDGQEFKNFWILSKVFNVYGSGIKTDRDSLFIDFEASQLKERMNFFYSSECFQKDFKLLYRVENSSSYKLLQRRQNTAFDLQNIYSILYRPFDFRYIYYSTALTSRPAWAVIRHILTDNNLALICSRQQSQQGVWSLIGVTRKMAECCAISNKTKEMNYLFPLYFYPETKAEKEMGMQQTSNFSAEFLKTLESKLGYLPNSEVIFYYIYGIFHSPTYRTRYAEFLKIDFPRVPLTSDDRQFRQLADYGEQLVGLHLMTSQTLDNPITEFTEEGGDRTVAPGHPKYSNGKVNINKQGDGFVGVPEEVWNFYVGGYQVCHKWLKDRKGRVLSDEDILHYQKIVVALQETIKLMQLIDEAITSWPIE